MSCHGCASKFSLFLKELSCSNCKFSFCNKCLKEKVKVDGKLQKVCTNCFKKLISDELITKKSEKEPPALLIKRLESLENPGKPPITVFKHSNKFSQLKRGLSKEDQDIIERLEKLKENRDFQVPPSEQEIKRRLALLQGRDEGACSKTSDLTKVLNEKSEQDQVEDLLKQYAEETAADNAYESDLKLSVDDMVKRFQRLKYDGASVPVLSTTIVKDEDLDVDAVTSKIIKKTLKEAALERGYEETLGEDADPLEEESELPWCIICNEDATIKCLDCDKSLYCALCFKEGHDYFEMDKHKTEPFLPKHKS